MGIEIKVTPVRELFFNEDNFFGIYGCEVNPDYINQVKINKWGNISIKGSVPRLNIGEEYTVVLKEDTDSKYQGSYIIESIKTDRPRTKEEQRRFLEAILTPNQVENIYDVYSEDDDIVGMIEDGAFDYTKVKGLGQVTFERLRKKVLENVDLSELLSFLSKYEIKYNATIAKLVEKYGNPQIVIEKIKKNPYLLTEVKGIGFKKADEIAKAIGFDMKSPHRIKSCIFFCISEENASGHSWISYKNLLNKTIDLLNIDKRYVEDILNQDIDNIIESNGRYTTRAVYNAEKYVAMKMIQYKTNSKKIFETEELDRMIDEYCEENGVELEENQRQFFHDWNENSILMLIGGGGMGKSWLQNILLKFIDTKHLSVALLAPTGKASKVMQGYTGRQASTIHRKAGVFEDAEEGTKEITEDVIIIDEASMCDVFILSKFFKALKNPNARILFVGDDFQLPSVGVGNFLYDVIHSEVIKVSRLKKVFRQEDGGILNVATDTREGKSFLNDTAEGRIVFGKDCVFWLVDQEYIRDGVLHNYKRVIQRFNPDDVVILSPTNKGKFGTIALNKEIQQIVNPPSPMKKERTVGRKDNPTTFRVGDSVMNVVNTYGIETLDGGVADIFNGDTGKIIDIDENEKVFIVDIDGIKVKIKFGNVLSQLVHSWVTTIHKSQGSQYKVVIVIVDKSMTHQLNANLLYTGFSRAKEYMLVLTQAQTVNRALRKFANMERRSFLQELLAMYNAEMENIEPIEESGEIESEESIADSNNVDGQLDEYIKQNF